MTNDSCPGCGLTVLVDDAGTAYAVEPYSGLPHTLHLCDDPAQRERIQLTRGSWLFRCHDCGSVLIARSSWGRIVDCPSAAWTAADWSAPHRLHRCEPVPHPTAAARPIWEAFAD